MHSGHLRALAVLCVLLAGASLAGGCGTTGSAVVRSTRNFPAGSGFSLHEFDVNGQKHTVWVFLPKNYQPQQKYPTIVFLHGLFEAGQDGSAKCLSGGLGPVVAQRADTWPFITIFPQSTGTWRGPERERIVIAAMDWAQQQYSIDSDRVILAGLSYGGLGTWEIGGRHPDRFAALVPVSGHRATDVVQRLMLLPVWAFDFKGDPFVPSAGSEEMCDKIRQGGGVARLTEFAGIGHDCWPQAVHNSDLVDWMLQQRRRNGTDIPPTTPAAVAADSRVAGIQ